MGEEKCIQKRCLQLLRYLEGITFKETSLVRKAPAHENSTNYRIVEEGDGCAIFDKRDERFTFCKTDRNQIARNGAVIVKVLRDY